MAAGERVVLAATFDLTTSAPPRPLVLHPFVPDHRAGDQVSTWRLLHALPTDRYEVVHWPCDNFLRYHDLIRRYWESDADLILIEQDVVPTIDQLAELLACPEPVCTVPYWIGPASSGQLGALISIHDGAARPYDETVMRAPHSALGCVKLAASWRASVAVPARSLWYAVENAINVRVQASVGTWHCHWPICAHYHGNLQPREVSYA